MSSQLRLLFTSVCKSNFIVTVIGVILPVRSNISNTFETQCLLVRFVRMIFCCCDGFFRLHFLAKFNSLMSSDDKSSLGNHLIPASLMLALSFDNVFGGSFPLNVTPFSENYPLFDTNSISSTFVIASFKFCAPGKQSSTYIFFCIMLLTSGNSTVGMRAVSRSLLSDWFPLHFIPYINVLINVFYICVETNFMN